MRGQYLPGQLYLLPGVAEQDGLVPDNLPVDLVVVVGHSIIQGVDHPGCRVLGIANVTMMASIVYVLSFINDSMLYYRSTQNSNLVK